MVCKKQLGQVSVPNAHKAPSRRYATAILLLILLLAAFLRLVNLGQSPPGLNQDEAANAWNAYCLLKTGKDQVGDSWPIFYLRALGSNNTPLYIYAMIPFLAVGGFSIWVARLLSAVAGILCIPLIYYVTSRLFDRRVGLVAALLLAFNPWHLHISRWAIEAGICPLLGIAPLALMLWANMPLNDDKTRMPRPVLAILAGALTGICCYGYWPILLFIPVFLALVVLATLPAWWRSLKTPKGALAIAAFTLAFALTFGPLVWQYIFYPEGIARRGQSQLPWVGSQPFYVLLKNIAFRYIGHFDLDFLFIRGDIYPIQSPPGAGQYHWYMLPLMVLGLITLSRRLKSSFSARILLVFIITYPVGDMISRRISLHALRSSPGLSSLIILAALGTVAVAISLYRRNRCLALATLAVLIIAAGVINVRYLSRFFGPYNRQEEIYHSYHVDLIEACDWLRPRFNEDKIDAVFCTTDGMRMPYIITLVALRYDPDRWFREARDFTTHDEFDIYTRYGKMHFMYGPSFIPALNKLQRNGHLNRVIFIVRPGELGFQRPIHQIYRPDGQVTLWICQPESEQFGT